MVYEHKERCSALQTNQTTENAVGYHFTPSRWENIVKSLVTPSLGVDVKLDELCYTDDECVH